MASHSNGSEEGKYRPRQTPRTHPCGSCRARFRLPPTPRRRISQFSALSEHQKTTPPHIHQTTTSTETVVPPTQSACGSRVAESQKALSRLHTYSPIFVSFPHPQQRKQRPQKDQPESKEKQKGGKKKLNEPRDCESEEEEGTGNNRPNHTGLGASAASASRSRERSDSPGGGSRGPRSFDSDPWRAPAPRPWCGSGAVEPRDLGFSRAAGVGSERAMGRRKMSAAAPPSRSWSNVGGSVIPGKIPCLGLMRGVALRQPRDVVDRGPGLLAFLWKSVWVGAEWRCSRVRSGIDLDEECEMSGSSVLA